ncbi:YCF48-related protein [Aquiflexum sp. TKW24L]|uniref:YCF48-related protein n=1 Tax=Aquiflexum sp. TKW24L TaxID=2942212 RepID=UPI0020C089AB|nr:YCF48-related protein [Aquiflexum sp. TKW24L]MCL6261394.1 YCF48-related protein [Aquiflexum sp. TKW24L]
MKKYTSLFLLSLLFISCSKPKKVVIPEKPTGWQKIETPTKASLRGLSPVTKQIVWASGSDGTWLKTLDGGETWESGIIDGLDSADFRDIEGIDANTAIAMASGQPAVIFKTSDGGKTWIKKYDGPKEAFLDGMFFIKNAGYVIGDVVDEKWMVLETKDQGETWHELELGPNGPIGGGSFAASGSGILADEDNIWFASAGKDSKIYHSADKGFHWEKYSTPIIQNEDSQGIFSMARIDIDAIVAVGGDFTKSDSDLNNCIISIDKGKTWRLTPGKRPSGYRSGVEFFSRFGWLITVGPNGSDFSTNRGDDWERFSDDGFHAVKVDHTTTSVWASGANGTVAKLIY